MATQPLGLTDIVDGYQGLGCCIFSLDGLDNQMSLLWDMKRRGVRLIHNGMSWSGVCRDEV